MIKSFFTAILIILLFLSAINCRKKEYDGRDLVIKDGLLYRQGEKKPFTGKVKDYLNGKILEYEVKNGLKDGEYILRYNSGKIEMEGKIVGNKNEGIWKYY